MKMSSKVEYGLVALADIAIHSSGKSVVSASDIAARQRISQKYLEQILVNLKHAGLIKAHKGSGGGYVLSQPAKAIVMSQVLSALDSSLLSDNEEPESYSANDLRLCVNICFWNRLNQYLRDFADELTLADLVAQCSEQSQSEWDMYVI